MSERLLSPVRGLGSAGKLRELRELREKPIE